VFIVHIPSAAAGGAPPAAANKTASATAHENVARWKIIVLRLSPRMDSLLVAKSIRVF
jgi:hypothetical protein